MLLDHSTTPGAGDRGRPARARPRGKRPGADRRWHPIPRAPQPAEPGRAETIAAIQAARERRHITQAGHDGLETRVCAMRRVLWRFRDQGAASGQYACSLEQLTVAVAPVVGWGPVPPASSIERARWFRAHRKSVQRWLELLTDAGLVHVAGVRDSDGYWWRTVVTLLPHGGPQLDAERLDTARRRVRGFKRRERARRKQETTRVARGGPPRRLRTLALVLRDSACPSPGRKRRIALARDLGVHERRRRATVEATIAEAARRRSDHLRVLTHPYGAPLSAELSSIYREAVLETSMFGCSAQTLHRDETLVDQTHDSDSAASRQCASGAIRQATDERLSLKRNDPSKTSPRGLVTETARLGLGWPAVVHESGEVNSPDDLGRLLSARVAARVEKLGPALEAVERRCREVTRWPEGRSVPRWRVREAWVVCHPHHGAQTAAASGTAAAGNVDAAQLAEALQRYEQVAAWRPPGWPASGAAALTVLAARGEARALAGDLARLQCITRDMRAAATVDNEATQLRRIAERTKRAQLPQTDRSSNRLAFRSAPAAVESTAEMRRRQRALLIYIGENPALFPNLGWAEQRLLAAEAAGEIPEDVVPPSAYRATREATRWTCAKADTDAPQTGAIARTDRYRRECESGRWKVPATWPGR